VLRENIEQTILRLSLYYNFIRLKGINSIVQAKLALGLVFPVATHTVELKDGLDVAYEINGFRFYGRCKGMNQRHASCQQCYFINKWIHF
jgi:hypothetical protein